MRVLLEGLNYAWDVFELRKIVKARFDLELNNDDESLVTAEILARLEAAREQYRADQQQAEQDRAMPRVPPRFAPPVVDEDSDDDGQTVQL